MGDLGGGESERVDIDGEGCLDIPFCMLFTFGFYLSVCLNNLIQLNFITDTTTCTYRWRNRAAHVQ